MVWNQRIACALITQQWELARTPIGTVEQNIDQFPVGDPVERSSSSAPAPPVLWAQRSASSWSTGLTRPAARGRFTEVAREPAGDGQTEFVIEWEPTVPQRKPVKIRTAMRSYRGCMCSTSRTFLLPGLTRARYQRQDRAWPGLGWTADAPVRVGAQVGSIRQSGAIDDQGRIGFCGTQQNGDRGALFGARAEGSSI